MVVGGAFILFHLAATSAATVSIFWKCVLRASRQARRRAIAAGIKIDGAAGLDLGGEKERPQAHAGPVGGGDEQVVASNAAQSGQDGGIFEKELVARIVVGDQLDEDAMVLGQLSLQLLCNPDQLTVPRGTLVSIPPIQSGCISSMFQGDDQGSPCI